MLIKEIVLNNFRIYRGENKINITPDGKFSSKVENYYQDKYKPVREKGNIQILFRKKT